MAEMCPIRGGDCVESKCRWWYELSDKHGSCSVTFGALMLHEILRMLQWEKRQQEKIWEVDEKTGAALLGRAGWYRNVFGGWEAPAGSGSMGMTCDFATALKSIGLELKE